MATDPVRPYRILTGRMAFVESDDNEESLSTFLRRAADAVEVVEREECRRTNTITEGVSHIVPVWRDEEGWSAILVIE